jgi:hypothetical protein
MPRPRSGENAGYGTVPFYGSNPSLDQNGRIVNFDLAVARYAMGDHRFLELGSGCTIQDCISGKVDRAYFPPGHRGVSGQIHGVPGSSRPGHWFAALPGHLIPHANKSFRALGESQ